MWSNSDELAVVLTSVEDRQLVSSTFVEQADPMDFDKPEVLKLVNEAIEVQKLGNGWSSF